MHAPTHPHARTRAEMKHDAGQTNWREPASRTAERETWEESGDLVCIIDQLLGVLRLWLIIGFLKVQGGFLFQWVVSP